MSRSANKNTVLNTALEKFESSEKDNAEIYIAKNVVNGTYILTIREFEIPGSFIVMIMDRENLERVYWMMGSLLGK